MHRNRRSLCVIAALAVLAWLQACIEGHGLPGTREGLSLDGGSDAGPVGDAGEVDSGEPDAGPPPPEPCNVALCQGASTFIGELPACCTAEEQCGLDFASLGLTACLQRDAPGVNDPACPDVDLFGFFTFEGCCAPSGQCGLVLQDFLPVGCAVEGIPIPGLPPQAPVACAPATPD